MKLLLLEDDLQLGRALQAALIQSGFGVLWLRRIQDARANFTSDAFALALIDIGLPDGSGLDYLREIRSGGDTTPVIMLTARDAVDDRVTGLDAGADDYLPKPFAMNELLSRIRAITRRHAGFAQAIWQVGPLTIEPERHRASLSGEPLELSQREFGLLLALARSAGKTVTRTQLELSLFNQGSELESNVLEVYVHNLRKKIGASRIRTIRGVGYSLEDVT